MSKPKILVLGGYGNWGKHVCETLAKDSNLEVWIAGRTLEKAQVLLNKIKSKIPDAQVQSCAIDWHSEVFSQKLKEIAPQIVIHCAGPYLEQDYTIAQTCVDLKIHYIDLADSRQFVVNISELDEKAKESGVVVISGANTVPGISSVVVDAFASKFAILREIDFGIAPANKSDRDNATIRALLAYAGKPFLRLENGQWKTVYGWQNVHRHYYGDNLGMRWHANVDIPDLELFPKRYPTVKTVVFHGGLELPMLHFIMWKMSWLTRAKIVLNWGLLSKPITAISKWFDKLGTDLGGMYIHLSGSNFDYQPFDVNWTLVAEEGHSHYIPIAPSIILVNKILKGQLPAGAQPCLGLFSLEEFEMLIKEWKIYSTLEEKEI